jgi:DNA-binding beta-propeller fold protein YncE
MIVRKGNKMTRSLRSAAWSLVPLLILAGCAAESPEPPETTVAAPTLSPGPGTYSSAMDIVLATTTPGASIRYTTDDSTPTATTGTLYTAPVHVADTLTLQAVAYRTGWTTSSVTSGQYTILPLVSAPAFAPGPGSYLTAQNVVLTTATPGATIRYTMDGSTPTAATGTLYAGAVPIAETLVLRAVAFRTGWTTSLVTTGQYVIGPAVTAPVFTPAPGSYAGPQDVVLSTLTAGASIRYTTDGSDPTETAGALYTSPVRLGTSLTLRAVAYLAGWTTSPVAVGDYTISTLVAAPVFSPPAGTYDSAREVTISTSTPEATIRYTVDGSTPTESRGTVYAAPVAVPETLTLKAVAYRAGWTASSVTSALYTIEPPEPAYAQYAYVANAESQTVSAFTVDPAAGTLAEVPGSPFAAGGTYPWCLAAHPSGKFLYVLNSSSRDISILGIDAASGALAETSASPCPTGGASPSWIAVEPAGKFLYVSDSATNSLAGFTVDTATGALTPIAGSPFTTELYPAGLAVDPSGKFAYAACAGSHAVSAFVVEAATGALTPVAGSPFGTGGLSPTTVGIDPTGKYLYVTNGATDNISAFSLDPVSGALTAVAGSPFAAGGTAPVFVGVDPTGHFAFAANAGSTISAFGIAAATGALTAVPGSPFAAEGIYPKSIAFEHAGKFAYVANSNPGTVSALAIDAATGALAAVAGSPFAAGNGPYSVVTVRIAR